MGIHCCCMIWPAGHLHEPKIQHQKIRLGRNCCCRKPSACFSLRTAANRQPWFPRDKTRREGPASIKPIDVLRVLPGICWNRMNKYSKTMFVHHPHGPTTKPRKFHRWGNLCGGNPSTRIQFTLKTPDYAWTSLKIAWKHEAYKKQKILENYPSMKTLIPRTQPAWRGDPENAFSISRRDINVLHGGSFFKIFCLW